MYKLITVILFCFCALVGKGQTFPNTTTQSSNSTVVKFLGGLTADSMFQISPTYADTTAANLAKAKSYMGSVIRIGNTLWVRGSSNGNTTPNKWYELTNSTSGGTVTSIAQGYGISNTPNPITTTGTIIVDTTLIISYTDTLKGTGIATKSDITRVTADSNFWRNVSSNTITTKGSVSSISLTGTVTSANITATSILNVGTVSQTTTSGYPMITFGGFPFIHNFIGVSPSVGGGVGRNTFMGINAGNPSGLTNTTYAQTGIGYGVLANTTTAYSNTGVGDLTLGDITTGFGNTGVGTVTLRSMIRGNNNSAFGHHALLFDTSGNAQTVIGAEAYRSHIDGDSNVIIGASAGYLNEHGSKNIFIGHDAGYQETGSNRFYLGAGDGTSALLYGELDNAYLRVNNNLLVTTNVASGTASITGATTIRSGSRNGGLVLGGDVLSTGITNATRKYGTFTAPHYLNAQPNTSTIITDNDVSENILFIGGGQALLNAATSVRVYAGATNTTTTGTEIQHIDINGTVNNGILTTTGFDNYAYNINATIPALGKITRGYVDSLHGTIGQYIIPFSGTSLTTASPYTNFSVTGSVYGGSFSTVGSVFARTDIGVENSTGASNLLYARSVGTSYTGISGTGIATTPLNGGLISTSLGNIGSNYRNLNIYSVAGTQMGVDTNTISFFQPTSGTRTLRIKSASITDGFARTQTFQDASGTIALTSDIPSVTGFVPYQNATANVNLGAFTLTASVSGGNTLYGVNTSGNGVKGDATTGQGVYGQATTGIAGYFSNTSSTNPSLEVHQLGNAAIAQFQNSGGVVTSIGNNGTLTTTGNIQGAGITATGWISGTLATASQPNITSVGSLDLLTITNTLNVGGTTNAVGTLYVRAPEADGSGSVNPFVIRSSTGAANQFVSMGINQTGTYSYIQSLQATVGVKELKLNPNGGVVSVGAPLQLTLYTVGTLPSCGAGQTGQIAYVTDALAPSFLVTVVGGGAVKTMVSCNGTNWVAQ